MNKILLHRRLAKLYKGYHNIFKFFLFLSLGVLHTTFERVTEMNLPLLRYLLYGISFYYFIKGFIHSYSYANYKEIFVIVLMMTLFFSIIYSIAISIPSIFSPESNFVNLKRALSGQILLYLFPLILLIKPNLLIWKKIFRYSYLFAISYLIFTTPLITYFISNPKGGAEGFIGVFSSGVSILLLTIVYHSKRVKIISMLTFIVSFLLMIVLARRNQILYWGLVFVFMLIIMLFSSSIMIRKKRFTFLISLVTSILLTLPVVYFFNFDFSNVTERFLISIDQGINYSRELVLAEFEADFNSRPIDWIFGRGINGSFYSNQGSGIDQFGMLISGQRQEIENGYYYFILKGGLIYLIPFVLLSVIGFIKGFFYSKNILSKGAASIVLINLFDMIGFGLPYLSLKYLILWFSLGLCYSSRIRSLSDNNVKRYIALK